ncbi:PREDICTED: taste receptor type 2 member 9-like, partial [Gekko japonicus]|uniref:Taste receptor type 2 n=1 Tax=Gekko japonicus TaxID=146911 RepID=A0ABM1LDY5_GEKJA
MSEFDALNVLCLVIVAIVIVVGVMGNGFIVLANGLDWIRSKTMPPSDMILTALSLSRLLFLGLVLAVHCLFFLDVDNPKSLPESLIFFWGFANATTLWMATCLAVFYCMKLVNLPQVFFVKMKLGLSRLVPRLLLGSVLVSFITSFPIIFFEKCSPCCNETRVVRGNRNTTCPQKVLSGIIYITGSSPSFVIVLASSVLLIRSLLHHARKMRLNMGGVKDHRMDVHIKAVKTLVSFVILFTASFVAVVSLAMFTSPWTIVTSTVVIIVCNSGHSVMLISMNPKLKQPLIRSLRGSLGRTLRRISTSCPKTA